MNEPLLVTSEGVYRTSCGKTVDVLDFGTGDGGPYNTYFRAYWEGGWYNVNEVPENAPYGEREMECVERVGEIEKSKRRARLPK